MKIKINMKIAILLGNSIGQDGKKNLRNFLIVKS